MKPVGELGKFALQLGWLDVVVFGCPFGCAALALACGLEFEVEVRAFLEHLAHFQVWLVGSLLNVEFCIFEQF